MNEWTPERIADHRRTFATVVASRAEYLALLDEIERLMEANGELLAACKFTIKWLGEPSLEESENANVSFKKAIAANRTAIAKAEGAA